MACPTPGDFTSCNPKCRCVGSSCIQAYNCDDPCGTGNIEDFDPTTCSCPDIVFSKPGFYINATEIFCDDGLQWDGWWRYPPYTEAQKSPPVSFELLPWRARDCSDGINTRSGLGILAIWSDGTTQRFFGGSSFTQDHNQSKTLNVWKWGDSTADYFYQLTIVPFDL